MHTMKFKLTSHGIIEFQVFAEALSQFFLLASFPNINFLMSQSVKMSLYKAPLSDGYCYPLHKINLCFH